MARSRRLAGSEAGRLDGHLLSGIAGCAIRQVVRPIIWAAQSCATAHPGLTIGVVVDELTTC